MRDLKAMIENEIGREVSFKSVKKTNDIKTGVFVVDRHVSPTVYVDDILDSNTTMEDKAHAIADRIEKALEQPVPDGLYDFKLDPETLLRNVVIHVVNAERNEDMLRDVPHRRFMDLACVIRFAVDINEDERCGYVLVTNELMKSMGFGPVDLFKNAVRNTKEKACYKIESLSKVLARISGMPEEVFIDTGVDIYVATTASGMNGASILAFKEYIESFSRKIDADVYILPSSVHEVLIMPKHEEFVPEELRHMVNDVNRTAVSNEDFLSDNVYEYNRENGELRVAV